MHFLFLAFIIYSFPFHVLPQHKHTKPASFFNMQLTFVMPLIDLNPFFSTDTCQLHETVFFYLQLLMC